MLRLLFSLPKLGVFAVSAIHYSMILLLSYSLTKATEDRCCRLGSSSSAIIAAVIVGIIGILSAQVPAFVCLFVSFDDGTLSLFVSFNSVIIVLLWTRGARVIPFSSSYRTSGRRPCHMATFPSLWFERSFVRSFQPQVG